MKAILLPIQPKDCYLIANERKKMDIRKSIPKLKTPFKCYIYCIEPRKKFDWGLCVDEGRIGKVNKINYDTANQMGMTILDGKVIGEFICDSILGDCEMANADIAEMQSCIRREEIYKYANGKKVYGLHISELQIYDKPKELSEFYRHCGDNPKCEGCEAHYYSNTESGLEEYCCSFIEGCKPLTSPPKNWRYVECQN